MNSHTADAHTAPEDPGRRDLFRAASGWFMAGGLVAGYGACAAIGGRYLYPARGVPKAWLVVGRTDEFRSGDSVSYRAPSGERIAIARQGESGAVDDFIALSSTCPHLGCQVHWEGQNDRFFCPCHNGAFDPSGEATAGPPAEAGQSLPRFPLKVEGDLLYIEVPTEALSGALAASPSLERSEGDAPPGPGHDPCLHPPGAPDPGTTA